MTVSACLGGSPECGVCQRQQLDGLLRPLRAFPSLQGHSCAAVPNSPHRAYFVYTVGFYGEKASQALALPHLERAVSAI